MTRGAELLALSSSNDQYDGSAMDTQSDNSMTGDEESGQTTSSPQQQRDPEQSLGMIPRLVASLFDMLYDAMPADCSIEYSIRCSFVEIYLEKMTDLLQPGSFDGGL